MPSMNPLQAGSMGANIKGWHAAALGGIVLFLLVTIMSCSGYNTLVRDESQIEAFAKDAENVHASIYTQMKAQGIAVEKYGDQVMRALQVGMEGRYGKTGSAAAFQFLQEDNPTIAPDVMRKLQQVIEAGFNRFEATQRAKIDAVRVYKNDLRTAPNNIVASMFGFPKINMVEAENIVTSATTKKDFQSGELSTPDMFAPAPSASAR